MEERIVWGGKVHEFFQELMPWMLTYENDEQKDSEDEQA